ncbi:MAG: response regulator transcription factor [Zavarzinia sp.]|nr:response regulator transcription factor [Zavarzinia sp.]
MTGSVTSAAGDARRLALVIEDLPDTRAALVAGVESAFPDAEIHAFGDIASARRWLEDYLDPARRAIALVDLALPDGSGIELIRLFAARFPRVLPIVATIFDDDGHLFEALGAGAQGYLLKDGELARIDHYLKRIDEGEPPLSPAIARRMMSHFRNPVPARQENGGGRDSGAVLTPREIDVLQLIGRGLRVGEAADVLGLTEHTVAGYVKALYRKLHVSSRAEAALEAARRGLV